VIAFARPANALHLVERDGRGRVSFLKVFEHFVTRHLQSKSIVPHVSELSLSKPESARSVAFMHIDSPKFYEEFRFILFRFFPLLRPGSVVVFQDFLYPWSAGLIAAVEGLRQSGFISYERTAASSLATRVLKRPTLEEVIEHYNTGGVPSATVDPFMKYESGGLTLSAGQKADLLAFLHTLTDTSFVHNPAFSNPH
jgi:hypothetical protein